MGVHQSDGVKEVVAERSEPEDDGLIDDVTTPEGTACSSTSAHATVTDWTM